MTQGTGIAGAQDHAAATPTRACWVCRADVTDRSVAARAMPGHGVVEVCSAACAGDPGFAEMNKEGTKMPIDQPPMSILTFPMPQQQQFITMETHYHGMLAHISAAGEVRINWKNVEATAADPKADGTTLALARLILAARDGTAKPLLDDRAQPPADAAPGGE